MTEKFDRMDFLEAVFGGYYQKSGNFLLVKTTGDPTRAGEMRYFPSYEKLGSAKFPNNVHVFLGVCPREKMKPNKEHIRFVTALWAGLDIGPHGFSGASNYYDDHVEMMEAVQAFPLKPSIMVRSGKGVHLYWLLKEVMELAKPEALEGLLRVMNKALRCETPVGADSLLRLPDTLNPRYAAPDNRCYVEFLDADLRYGANDFRQLEGKMPPPGHPRSLPAKEPVANAGGGRPAG